jgi:DNA-3-methyladenine glycosylase II
VDLVEAGTYRRLLWTDGAPVLLTVEQEGTPARAALRIRLAGRGARSRGARRAAERHVQRTLGAALDVRPFYRAFRDDRLLGAPIRAFRGLRIAGWPTLWETLLTAILSQQVNLAFAYSIRRELALEFGRKRRVEGVTYVTFPTPERIAREDPDGLRGFRLSGAKARAIHELAQEFASGRLSQDALEALPDDAAVERLTALRGVGRWTAEIALIRGLGRIDAFPAADLGVVKYVAQGLLGRRKVASEREMRRFAQRWRPYRALALAYAYAELERRQALARTD